MCAELLCTPLHVWPLRPVHGPSAFSPCVLASPAQVLRCPLHDHCLSLIRESESSQRACRRFSPHKRMTVHEPAQPKSFAGANMHCDRRGVETKIRTVKLFCGFSDAVPFPTCGRLMHSARSKLSMHLHLGPFLSQRHPRRCSGVSQNYQSIKMSLATCDGQEGSKSTQ